VPLIFDNIEQKFLPALRQALELADHADFCVGYFNLRGWKEIDRYVERWAGGKGHCCRLLVGMQSLPQEELRAAFSLARQDGGMDNQTVLRLQKKLAEEFRDQLTYGAPTNEDEAALRRLAGQLRLWSSCSSAIPSTPSFIFCFDPTPSTRSSVISAAAT